MNRYPMTDAQIRASVDAYVARGYVRRAAMHVVAVVFQLDFARVERAAG